MPSEYQRISTPVIGVYVEDIGIPATGHLSRSGTSLVLVVSHASINATLVGIVMPVGYDIGEKLMNNTTRVKARGLLVAGWLGEVGT